MSLSITILDRRGELLLKQVAPGVFDNPIDEQLTHEFLNDPRHHIAVAIEDDTVVGMATGVHYVHPDKEPQLFINEVGVAPTHQKRGIGQKLMDALLNRGRELGCTEAWVLTDRTNIPAMRLYSSCVGVEAPQDSVMFTFKLR